MTTSRFDPWSQESARDIVSVISDEPGPVLRCLQGIQERFGYVHADAIAIVAERIASTIAGLRAKGGITHAESPE